PHWEAREIEDNTLGMPGGKRYEGRSVLRSTFAAVSLNRKPKRSFPLCLKVLLEPRWTDRAAHLVKPGCCAVLRWDGVLEGVEKRSFKGFGYNQTANAKVAELADAPDLGSGGE